MRRSREIAAIVLKYRLGSIFNYRFAPTFNFKNLTAQEKTSELTTAQRFRLALEELGPTFIKLGQMLSTRPDLVPKEFIEELSLLQDKSFNSAISDIKSVLAEEWGSRAYGKFRNFNVDPFAVASLSQVHEAVLKNGERVAVKIQKPGIEEIIKLDLIVLKDLTENWQRKYANGWLFQPEVIFDEFSRVIKRELNFIQEAQNYERFRQNFKGDETVKFPKIYWELTTSKVLTMEFMDGVKITDTVKPEWENEFNPTLIIERSLNTVFKQIFEDGFFNADLHPANIIILPGNIIGGIDMGMVGWLDEKTIWTALKMFNGFTAKNPNQLLYFFEELGLRRGETDADGLTQDLREFVNRYYALSLKQQGFGDLINELIEILVRHNMSIPRNLVMASKVFMTIEYIGRQLDKNFNFFQSVHPILKKLFLKRFTASAMMERIQGSFHDFVELLNAVPQEITAFAKKLHEGKLKFIFEHNGLEHFVETLEKSANRMSLSIIIASFMLSWALIIKSQGLVTFLGSVGVIGLIVAIIWAIVLFISITRPRK